MNGNKVRTLSEIMLPRYFAESFTKLKVMFSIKMGENNDLQRLGTRDRLKYLCKFVIIL